MKLPPIWAEFPLSRKPEKTKSNPPTTADPDVEAAYKELKAKGVKQTMRPKRIHGVSGLVLMIQMVIFGSLCNRKA
jgi:hypothetical protein